MNSESSSVFHLITPRFVRRGTIALLAAMAVSGSVGCYGTFPLTNAVYDWNGRATDNHIINSIIMIVFAIFPVYGICIWVDALIINSISYWSGNEVMIAQSYEQPDGSVATLAPGSQAGEAILTVERDGKTITTVNMVRDAEGVTTLRDASGVVLGTVRLNADGSLELANATGDQAQTVSANQIAQLVAAQ